MPFLVLLLLVTVYAYRSLEHEQRRNVLRPLVEAIRQAVEYGDAELQSFRQALRARNPRTLATTALAAVNIVIFAGMLFGAGERSDPATIIGWGGSFGPRTTNGEWWRLATAMFVNPQTLQLAINVAAIAQLGLTLERIVGPAAFVTTYFSAGIIAGLVGVWSAPTAVIAGAAGAVFGLYGLLIACGVQTWRRGSDVTIPAMAFKRLAPIAAIFLLYSVVDAGVVVGLAGMIAGLLFGVLAARDVPEHTPPARRAGIALAATMGVAIVAAIPLRGIADVRPEMLRMVAAEQRMAATYQTASAQFAKRRIPAGELADVIERSILPEVRAVAARIDALHGVPREEQWRIAEARRYLQLRSESWRLRATALRNAGMASPANVAGPKMTFRAWAEARHEATQRAFGKAEGDERESLEALNRVAVNTIPVHGG